jgi:ubiquitin C-terminal hydrolase
MNNNQNQNQNNINQMNNKKLYPFSKVQNPIKTHLEKLGKTEYLNAILYLIGNLKVFCKYFYNPNQDNNFVKNFEKAPLSFIIHRLFLHLYPLFENEKTKSYKPEAFKKYLSDINCVYKSDKKRNPNELFSFILDTLHNELKKPPKGALKNPKDIFNRKKVIYTGIKNFQNCNISKISEYFNWFEIKAIKCTQCSKIMYSFHTYHMLELDILNTSKFNNNKNSITIYDCLTYYQTIKKDLRAYCKSCNKNTIVECGSQIYSNPNIFIFSLNRGLINGNADDNLADIKFKLDEKIDLNNFVENNQISRRYELIGIVSISHRMVNNYVSLCKSPVDNNWYLYENQNIELKTLDYVISEHDTDKDSDCIPCILVYQLI